MAIPAPELVYGRPRAGWRRRLFDVIFYSDTPAGRAFDLALIVAILASCVVVVLDSVAGMHRAYGAAFEALEWAFTLLFTLEYGLRLACVERPWRYARGFYGVIDLAAILPTYVAFMLPAVHPLLDVRLLRLLRIFRILRLGAYAVEFDSLGQALAASRRRILVFLGFVFLVVVVMGTLMYVVEGPESGFVSIPTGMYWAITTLTTVGFGDLAPKTTLGRGVASLMMLLGWGILAVPTGIVTAELAQQRRRGVFAADSAPSAPTPPRRCPACRADGHREGARFCHDCGAGLDAVVG